MILRFLQLLSIGLLVITGSKAIGEESPLGYPVELSDIYIPGNQVEPIPRKDQSSSIVIRVIEIKPAEDGFRYHFEVYGLDPGSYNLLDYLRYSDTKNAINNSATIPIEITVRHSLDTLPKPEELAYKPPGRMGGYRILMTMLGILWVVGLGFLIFYRKKSNLETDTSPPEPTLHEKLHALVASASKGELDEAEQANLERLIIGHWKQEIPDLDQMSPSKALTELRTHPKASPLILKLEQWLHSPERGIGQQEIEPLLEPFKHVS